MDKSYGSRLALRLAQLLPGRIRALALDGAYPPDFSATEGHGREHSRPHWTRLFVDCELDPECGRAFPEFGIIVIR